jgi:peptidoglycan/LPS O-acetylase OafA/YrhL
MGLKPAPPRLQTLDALRGIAALAVCWYHLTSERHGFLPDGLLKSSGKPGWMGVDVFFVISGFIIPYTLWRNAYKLSDYGIFLLKRVVRLDPPYLVSMLGAIVLGYASTATPAFRGPPFTVSFAQVALHLGYMNTFFNYPWIIPVYWTLGVEVQYYVFAGLAFPAIVGRSAIVRASAFAAMACTVFLTRQEKYVFHWMFLFMLGMAAFQLRAGILSRRQFTLWVGLLGAGSCVAYGSVIAAVGVSTCLLLGLLDADVKQPLLFFGRISYSLYLVHEPICMRTINLGLRFVDSAPGKLAVLAAAFALSIAAAWTLNVLVERPAQRWSSRIRYRGRRDTGTGPVLAAGLQGEPVP